MKRDLKRVSCFGLRFFVRMFDFQLFGSVVVGACSDQEEMQQMERLLFEEFRGQQELDSEEEKDRLDGVDN